MITQKFWRIKDKVTNEFISIGYEVTTNMECLYWQDLLAQYAWLVQGQNRNPEDLEVLEYTVSQNRVVPTAEVTENNPNMNQ